MIKKIFRKLFPKKIKPPTWKQSLNLYIDWANNEVPESYRKTIIRLSRNFNVFSDVKPHHKILDVGCGINKLGGMSYKKFYGWDDADNPNWQGIDPLKGRATVIGVAENMKEHFKDNIFDKIQISTTLDHFKDWRKALKECVRVMKPEGEINIWFTDTNIIDTAHSFRVDLQDLKEFTVNQLKMTYLALIEPWNKQSESMTVFFKISISEKQ